MASVLRYIAQDRNKTKKRNLLKILFRKNTFVIGVNQEIILFMRLS